MMGTYTGEDPIDVEDLRLDLDEKANDVAELKQALRAVKLEGQQLRLRLEAVQQENQRVQLPSGPSVGERQRAAELQNLLTWVARHVDLGEEPWQFHANAAVQVGQQRTVQLGFVAQWPLRGLPLRLSVPQSCMTEVRALLCRGVDSEAAARLSASWDFCPSNFTRSPGAAPEPVVVLPHRSSMEGILIAAWPLPPAAASAAALGSISEACPQVGERVEVEWEGQWLPGHFICVDSDGFANVQCDVDAPDVYTQAPLHCLRRSSQSSGASKATVGSAPVLPETLGLDATRQHGSSRRWSHRRTRSALY